MSLANEMEKALKGTQTLAIAKASAEKKAQNSKPKRPKNGDEKSMKAYHKAMRQWMNEHNIERKPKSTQDNQVAKRIRQM